MIVHLLCQQTVGDGRLIFCFLSFKKFATNLVRFLKKSIAIFFYKFLGLGRYRQDPDPEMDRGKHN